MMKRAIAMTVLAACIGGLGPAAALPLAGQPSPPASAAPSPALRVLAPENRPFFAGCPGGAAAAALLAERRDASALATADASFQTCMRTSRDQNDVAAAELGIAVTAFFTAQTHVGPAAISDYNRAVGYAHQAGSRSLNAHRATTAASPQPAPVHAAGVVQAAGTGNTARGTVQGPMTLADLAQSLEAAATRARADALTGK